MKPTKVYKSMLLAGMLVSLHPACLRAEDTTHVDENLYDSSAECEQKEIPVLQEPEKAEDIVSQIEITAQIQTEENALESEPPGLPETIPQSNHEESNLEESNHEELNHEELNHEEPNPEESNHEELNLEELNLKESNPEESNPEELNLEESNSEQSTLEEPNPGEPNLEQVNSEQSNLEQQNPKQNEKLNIEIDAEGLPFYYRTVTDYLWDAKTHTYQEHNHGEWINNYQRILIKNKGTKSADLKLFYDSMCEKNVSCLIISQETGDERVQQEFRINPGEEKIFYLHLVKAEKQIQYNGAIVIGKITLVRTNG